MILRFSTDNLSESELLLTFVSKILQWKLFILLPNVTRLPRQADWEMWWVLCQNTNVRQAI